MKAQLGEYVSLPEAARQLGVSWPVAWRKVLTQELAGQQVGNRWLVSQASVDRALQERAQREQAARPTAGALPAA